MLWEDTTYNDRHVLLAASTDFNPNAPGALVVFFHGNNATLARDVVERQQTVRQLAQANLNAVLVAPQMAVDARDSSAGNFWRPGAFAQFLDEADGKLAELYPQAARAAFRRMPVILVAYSGGYLPAAYSLAYGGAGDRIRGVVLLDALYGEPDKFARWIESETGRAFFVSAFSGSSKTATSRCRRASSATAFPPRRPARQARPRRRRLRRRRRRRATRISSMSPGPAIRCATCCRGWRNRVCGRPPVRGGTPSGIFSRFVPRLQWETFPVLPG